MPIITLQKRARELGRIRIGQVQPTSNGKTRPAKLDRFRLTSASKPLLEKVAELYGGEVAEWTPANGGAAQWEVVTDSTRLPILVPPQPVTQWYELWSGGGCKRRCDGRNEILTDSACLCAQADEMLCKPTTRLNVVLRDVEGIGVFRLESHGYYAAVELPDVAAFLAQAGGYVEAFLALEERVVKREINGKPETRRFMVPTIEIEGVTPGQLMAGQGGTAIGSGTRAAIAAGDEGQAAIEAGRPAPTGLTPEDFLVRARAAGTFAEFQVIWKEAGDAGISPTDAQKAEMTSIGQRLKAAAESQPAAPTPPAAGSGERPGADADALWNQIVAASPWPMSELRERFVKAMGAVAPEDASEAELEGFLKRMKAGEFNTPPAAPAEPPVEEVVDDDKAEIEHTLGLIVGEWEQRGGTKETLTTAFRAAMRAGHREATLSELQQFLAGVRDGKWAPKSAAVQVKAAKAEAAAGASGMPF